MKSNHKQESTAHFSMLRKSSCFPFILFSFHVFLYTVSPQSGQTCLLVNLFSAFRSLFTDSPTRFCLRAKMKSLYLCTTASFARSPTERGIPSVTSPVSVCMCCLMLWTSSRGFRVSPMKFHAHFAVFQLYHWQIF